MNPTALSLEPSSLAVRHLQGSLQRLVRILSIAVEHQNRVALELTRHDVTPLCVSDEQVQQLLDQVRGSVCFFRTSTTAEITSPEELRFPQTIREQASAEGVSLPLDALAADLELSDFERDVVVTCLAPELHPGYRRIFAYIQDDLNCQLPTIGLLSSLFAHSEDESLNQRALLSVHGRLRRLGVILTSGDNIPESSLSCRLAPRAIERLLTFPKAGDPAPARWSDLFFDPDEIALDEIDLASFPDGHQLQRAAQALRKGSLDILAIWDEADIGQEAAAHGVARDCGKPLRKLPLQSSAIADALSQAAFLGAFVWIDADQIVDSDNRQLANEVVRHLTRTSTPLLLTGRLPWRPPALLVRRRYSEIQLSAPDEDARSLSWRQVMPDLSESQARTLSQRYRLTPRSVLAAKKAAETQAVLQSNGALHNPVDELDDMCTVMSQTRGCRFTRSVLPKRGPEDLVLPASLHTQVIEIARFYRALTQVNERWGFANLSTGAGGIKALFSGDSGTGKSLAAEVIAREIGLPMLKVDLSQVVSKWIGETEKNIDAAFCEAETRNDLLFFDEADTLYGKRGEVQRGSDRYANLEVGYLLQRLDQFAGLAVLATNLHDQIDQAFIRRLQVVLHFPRPAQDERLRLWRMALPQAAPVEEGVNVADLVHLDMTGASIFSACHTAALLAADEGSDVIGRRHIAEGVARQFHRESRILGQSDLTRFLRQPFVPVTPAVR